MNRKASFLTMVALAAGTLLGAVSGCELLAPVDRSKIDGSGGSGGALSGGGGSSSTTTTTSPTTGGGGSGGCMDATDCAVLTDECKVAVCDAPSGNCGEAATADGADAKTQTPGDCKKNVCTAGAVTSESDDSDPLDDANECTDDACDAAGMPTSMPSAIGAVCTVGGTVCDGLGACVQCNVNADCKDPEKPACDDNKCVDVKCKNGVKDPDETDKDCGGACAACDDLLACAVAGDCKSGVCTGMVCQAPKCDDTVKNGAETDKDCGGNSGCPKCKANQGCNADGDCLGAQCTGAAGTCVPNCADTEKNGTETDVDCGGGGAACNPCNINQDCGASDANCVATAFCNAMGKCTADKVNGQGCLGTSQCVSGQCADGVCCNTACAGTCFSCNLAAAAGTCSLIVLGQDPENECNGSDVCDGNGACGKVNGTVCAAGGDCASGSCVDSVCCDNACSGTCKACTMAKTGQANGTCSNVTMDTDPDSECLGALNCAAGACGAPQANGATCTVAGECNSGFCADGVCCNSGCGGTCRSCGVAGSLGTCTLHAAGTDPEMECNGATPDCNGSGLCAP